MSQLKNDSIVAHDSWVINGSPRSGPVFEAKKHAYYRYKLAIRKHKLNQDQKRVDDLTYDLIEGDQNKFWRSFKYFNNSKASTSSRINGLTDNVQIANCFADSYSQIYRSNDMTQSTVLHNKFNTLYNDYSANHADDSIKSLYLSWSEMLDVLSKLEPGKATASFVKVEHVWFA